MNVSQQMATYRPQMLSYAARQLGDDNLAEDVVQDAYVAAFDKAGAFRGEAALKTWVFAILKHKIADALRGRYRRQSREVTLDEDPDGDELEALLFRQDGHWETDSGPGDMGNPEQLLTNREFWTVLQRCLAGLPGIQAQVFMMREHLGMSASEICSQTQLTANNINVMLYRARLKLQKCLQQNWLDNAAAMAGGMAAAGGVATAGGVAAAGDPASPGHGVRPSTRGTQQAGSTASRRRKTTGEHA